MTGPLEISPWNLALTLLFVLVAQISSLVYKLKLERDLAIGTVRTFVQLLLMGYVLKFIFQVQIAWLTLTVYAVMITAAAQIIKGRVGEKSVPYLLPMYLSMMISYFLVSYMVTGVIISASPWWLPQYFLPLGGMIIGNSMNALALALERLLADLRGGREQVEMKLSLGANYREASEDVVRRAIKAGMIPSINSLMGVGIVFIPGMMTGQIVAGADPLAAVRYQIVVMLMLVASTTISTLMVVLLTRRRCFGEAQQLILS
ncbi:MAG TPA: iron export ABC transporter permease subunit FetB [Thermodesulfobacteriota bacterium]|nr:iron export ABC transporter permease subunit FetB [Thermodesulfobacteriota bacterium]